MSDGTSDAVSDNAERVRRELAICAPIRKQQAAEARAFLVDAGVLRPGREVERLTGASPELPWVRALPCLLLDDDARNDAAYSMSRGARPDDVSNRRVEEFLEDIDQKRKRR